MLHRRLRVRHQRQRHDALRLQARELGALPLADAGSPVAGALRLRRSPVRRRGPAVEVVGAPAGPARVRGGGPRLGRRHVAAVRRQVHVQPAAGRRDVTVRVGRSLVIEAFRVLLVVVVVLPVGPRRPPRGPPRRVHGAILAAPRRRREEAVRTELARPLGHVLRGAVVRRGGTVRAAGLRRGVREPDIRVGAVLSGTSEALRYLAGHGARRRRRRRVGGARRVGGRQQRDGHDVLVVLVRGRPAKRRGGAGPQRQRQGDGGVRRGPHRGGRRRRRRLGLSLVAVRPGADAAPVDAVLVAPGAAHESLRAERSGRGLALVLRAPRRRHALPLAARSVALLLRVREASQHQGGDQQGSERWRSRGRHGADDGAAPQSTAGDRRGPQGTG